MSSITEVATAFFAACDTGKGWDACRSFCTPDATFSAQAEPLQEIRTLQQYTVYVMQFEDGRIVHMTKIWNSGMTLKELGWI